MHQYAIEIISTLIVSKRIMPIFTQEKTTKMYSRAWRMHSNSSNLYFGLCVMLVTEPNVFRRTFFQTFICGLHVQIDCVTGTYLILVILRNRSLQLDIETHKHQTQYTSLCGCVSRTFALQTHTNRKRDKERERMTYTIHKVWHIYFLVLSFIILLSPKIALSQKKTH